MKNYILKPLLRLLWLVLSFFIIGPVLYWTYTGDSEGWFELKESINDL